LADEWDLPWGLAKARVMGCAFVEPWGDERELKRRALWRDGTLAFASVSMAVTMADP